MMSTLIAFRMGREARRAERSLLDCPWKNSDTGTRAGLSASGQRVYDLAASWHDGWLHEDGS